MEPAELSWHGKVAVVTGAASGIGLALARRFAAEQMAVVLADHDADRLEQSAAAVRAAGATEVLAVVTDVRQEASVHSLADRVESELGTVHVLCNNAGVIRPGMAWELTPEDWDAIMGVNVGGVLNGMRAFVPRMLAHGEDCHLVNTASAAGFFAAPSFAGYCASKAAVVSLTEALAEDLRSVAGAKLHVSVLCPGGVATDLYRREVERRSGTGDLSDQTARRWSQFSSPDRTDQLPTEEIADQVWAAMQDRRFWILPMQPHLVDAARARLQRLDEALDAVDRGKHSTRPDGVLRSYYERVDGPAPTTALDLVADDLVFNLARPERRIEGTSREALAAYIDERPPLSHRLLGTAATGDVEFALGESVDGDTVLGTFIAAVRADPTGRLDRYVAAFYPDLRFGAGTEL